eukprot:373411-Prymnesium_polylepis.1
MAYPGRVGRRRSSQARRATGRGLCAYRGKGGRESKAGIVSRAGQRAKGEGRRSGQSRWERAVHTRGGGPRARRCEAGPPMD